jgi:predicted ATPase
MKTKTPAYYKSLSLENFRGFKKVDEIPLAPLTFLVGPNSSGKSSICDALLLLIQSDLLLTDEPPLVPKWIGPLVDLGTFRDTVFGHNDSLNLRIAIEVSLDSSGKTYDLLHSSRHPVKFEFHIRSSKDDPVGNIRLIGITDSLSNERVVIRFQPTPSPKFKLKYLRRTHEIPLDKKLTGTGYPLADMTHVIEKAYDKRSILISKRKAALRRVASYMRSHDFFTAFTEGTQRVSSGRAAPQRWFLRTNPDELLPNSLRKIFNGVYPAMVESIDRSDMSRGSKQLSREHRKELNRILKELNIATNISASHLSPYHSTIEIRDSETKVESNLMDVGYGASQIIPVITACLSNRAGPLFVEQPEIHLHPKAQGTIAELLCETSLKRQVLVETHSVHMINRARLRVARGLLDPKNVTIIFVNRDSSGSQMQIIPIKENGDFGAEWPGGFFDERYEDTMALLQLKSQGEE